MNNLKNRAEILKKEAIDRLYNKPVNSTMLERIEVIDAADKAVAGLPQYLQIGKGSLLIAQNVSKPIHKADILLGRIPEVVPNEVQEEYLNTQKEYGWVRSWQQDRGHNTFAWDELVAFGLSGLKNKTQTKIEELKADGEDPATIGFMNSKVMIYDAYIKYILDYADAAKKAGLEEEAEICSFLTENAPKTFRQAMQLILFVGTFFSAYITVVSALSYGRLDKILLPLYEKDINSGVMSEEDAECIILDFYCKNNLILGRGEHQLAEDEQKNTGWFRNPMYDSPQYVVLGGYPDIDSYHCKKTPDNALTRVFLNAFSPKFKNPVLVYRHSKPFSERNYHKLCRMLMDNASILNYNDETMIPAYVNMGIKLEDAVDYSIHACNWPDIAGKHISISTIPTNLAAFIRDTMIEQKNQKSCDYESIEDFYTVLFDRYRLWLGENIENIRALTNSFPNRNGCLMHIDCFMNGSAECIYPAAKGGLKYTTVYNQFRYIGSAIDAMTAIDYLVFREKKTTFEKFTEALEANFDGYDELYIMCKKAPKYGDDSAISNFHTEKLLKGFIAISEELSRSKLKNNIVCFNTAINDNNHRSESRLLGATADGRKQGELLSENISPASRIKNGSVTALFNSAVKLPFEHLACGALNIKLNKNILKGEAGIEIFKGLMKVYLEKGGMQSQWSFISTAELREAQQNPEKFKDLLVRVTGYSAIFVDMSKQGQDEMIIRSEMA